MKKLKFTLLIGMLMLATTAFAQGGLDAIAFDDELSDTPLPGIAIAIIAAIGIGIVKLRAKK
ncbi:hypothetical protein LX97_01273 [Nonlabens dokdonensis]|jgi:hypothetical protein|uniref:Secreted protein n=2 Tax=Nonlabens dokdonensis TaxID=328515 RepID=L7W8X7_NONDD|nr:hypothetical protein [Nonlabens dokdonensis]AGC76614.1 hypothetical protein DDD_1487 [Nonlabens dokdonensis DSW-6]PZX44262.1 hypothetical protein LX97_01273 [Nonlabens dokdonensis]